MNCTNVREKLSMYIDDILDSEEVTALEEHLAGCGECMKEYDELSQVTLLLRAVPSVSLPASFDEKLSASLAALPVTFDAKLRASIMEEGPFAQSDRASRRAAKKKRLQKISSVAAVFVIGIFSVVMYNHIGGAENGTAQTEMMNGDEIVNAQPFARIMYDDDVAETYRDMAGGAFDEQIAEIFEVDGERGVEIIGEIEEPVQAEEWLSHQTDALNNEANRVIEEITRRQNGNETQETHETTMPTIPENGNMEYEYGYGYWYRNHDYLASPILENGSVTRGAVDREELYEEYVPDELSEEAQAELQQYLSMIWNRFHLYNYRVLSYTKDEYGVWVFEVEINALRKNQGMVTEVYTYLGQDMRIWRKDL